MLQPGHCRPRPLGRRPRVCGLSLNLALANHATGTTGGRLSCQGSVKGASLLVILHDAPGGHDAEPLKRRLNPASAQTIGLALHELATNAGKYGALSADSGRVDVCWGTVGDTFTMSWTERDGPPISAPKRRGFGSTVIEAMAKHSLGGAIDLDFAPSGVTWQLVCPVANALDRVFGHREGLDGH